MKKQYINQMNVRPIATVRRRTDWLACVCVRPPPTHLTAQPPTHPQADPSYEKTMKACEVVFSLTKDARPALLRLNPFLPPAAIFLCAYVTGATSAFEGLPANLSSDPAALAPFVAGKLEAGGLDAALLAAFLAAAAFLLAYALTALTYSPAVAPLAEKKKTK